MNFRFPATGDRWARAEKPLLTCVNSFGLSGTNGSAIVEQFRPPALSPTPIEPQQALCLSAQSPRALRQLAERHAARLLAGPIRLQDYCFTANTSRVNFKQRAVVSACSQDELLQKLTSVAIPETPRPGPRPVQVLLFESDSGASQLPGQWLLGRSAAFAKEVARATDAYAEICHASLRDVLFGAPPSSRRPQYWLPALFAYQYALSKALAEVGVEPDAVAGNAVGRCTAAVVSGLMDFKVGLQLAAALGILRSEGATDEVAVLRLKDVLVNVTLNAPDIPLIHAGGSAYGSREITQVAYFVAELLRSEVHTWRPQSIEPGRPTLVLELPGLTARSTELESPSSAVSTTVSLFAGAREEQADWLSALCTLFEKGFDVDFAQYYASLGCHRLPLPTYPFQQRPHWVPAAAAGKSSRWSFAEPLKRGSQRRGIHKLALPEEAESRYELSLSVAQDRLIHEHRLGERCVLAGSMQMAFLFDVFSLEQPNRAIRLHDLVLLKPMLIGDCDELVLHARVTPSGDRFEAKVFASTQPEQGWHHLCTTSVEILAEGAGESIDIDLPAIARTWQRTTTGTDFYDGLRSLGYQLGNSYSWLADGWYLGPQTVRELAKQPGVESAPAAIHPGLLDSAMQSVDSSGASSNMRTERGHIYIPLMLKALTLYRRPDPASAAWVHSEMQPTDDLTSLSREAQVTVFDGDRRVIAKWDRIEYRQIALQDLERGPNTPGPYYQLRWEPFSALDTPATQLHAILVYTTADPATVRERLRPLAREIIVVRLREQHRRHDRLTFDSGGTQDLDKLETALSQDFPRVDAVYYDARNTSQGDYDAALESNFYYPLQIIRLLGRAESTVKEFVFITAEAQPVLANETVGNPYAAMQWSLARTARNEYPAVTFRVVDSSPDAALDVLAQLRRMTPPPLELAVRNEQLYVPVLANLTLPSKPLTVDAAAHYLVTGGTRGVGLLACQSLKALGARRFLIAARNVDDAVQNSVRAALGGPEMEIEFVAVDLADPSQVRRQLRPILERVSLKGIIHAAGQQSPQRIASFDIARSRRDLDTKALSLLTIHGIVDPMRLDFILCTSSISALFGTPGAAAYSAANAFLDAYMQSLTPRTPGARSVQFGSWSEVGMFAGLSQREQSQFEDAGVLPITSAQGSQLLRDALSTSLPNFMAANFDWEKLLAGQSEPESPDRFAAFRHLQRATSPQVAATATDSALRAWMNLRIDERISWLTSFYCELVARVCHLDPGLISPTESMSRFGIDSVVALEIRKAVQDFCGLELSIPAILDNATITGLVETTLDFIVDTNPSLFSLRKWSRLDAQQQSQWLSSFYLELVARVCQLDAEQLSHTESMTRYGLDSVMAVEIRRAVQQFCGFELAINDILDDATIETMIEKTRRFIDSGSAHRHSTEGTQQ
jgi:acyl transferase domain-containing protein/NADP-dependent 3-hydroxy acid dehydrogenase YdfG/acyl carrier protein